MGVEVGMHNTRDARTLGVPPQWIDKGLRPGEEARPMESRSIYYFNIQPATQPTAPGVRSPSAAADSQSIVTRPVGSSWRSNPRLSS